MSSPAQQFNNASLPTEAVQEFLRLAVGGTNAAIMAAREKYGPGIADARDEKGRTALIIACAAGHTGAISTLLNCGSDMEAKDSAGNTALMAAARAGNKTIAGQLLDRGADVNATNDAGQTALFHAVTHRNNNDRKHPLSKKKKETIGLLLERGVWTQVKDDKGNTAESWARRHGYGLVADRIAEHERLSAERRANDIAMYSDGLPETVVIQILRIRIDKPGL